MGMFDIIYVAPLLPVKLPYDKDPRMIEWQTKCFPDPSCLKYRLTWDGVLEERVCDPSMSERPEPWSSKGWVDARHLLEDDHDSIDFYDLRDDEFGTSWWTEFRAIFDGRRLVRIEHVATRESGYEAHQRSLLASAIEARAFEADRRRRLSTMATDARIRYEARRLAAIEADRAIERRLSSVIYGTSDDFKAWAGRSDVLPSLFKKAPTAPNPRRIPWPWEKTDD